MAANCQVTHLTFEHYLPEGSLSLNGKSLANGSRIKVTMRRFPPITKDKQPTIVSRLFFNARKLA